LFSFNNFGKRNSTSDFFSDDRIKYKLVDFLKHADTGITSAKVEDVKPPDNLINFDKKLTDLITMHLGDAKLQYETNIERKRISFAHKGVDGADVYLDINSESKGTLALIKMLGPLFYCLSDGKTVFIDEIDTSMHSLLTTKLINLFNSANSNTNCAQIIFSTHDTSILSCEVLRRDEIYFTEKNNEGSTEIIPLAYIKSRQTDNFERGYLQGRYGGIPFLGNLDDLFVGKEDAE
jgi:AAA15 family ATPase/GTPase